MEPATAWATCEFQLANWAIEEPAAGFPVEYASIDIPCGGQQQLEYYYYSAAAASGHTQAGESHAGDVDGKAKISNDSRARSVVKQVVSEFKDDVDMTKKKMHRYPACLGAVDKCYTMPRIVAIGPYHHGLDHLKQAEKVKHAAACHCVKESGRLLEDMYGAVVRIEDNARRVYDIDVMAGIGCDDFRHMMFFDACFLVQFMLMRGSRTNSIDKSLEDFMSPIRKDIFHDVMLLENQLPWEVVETVMSFMSVSDISRNFVKAMKNCMLSDDRHEPPPKRDFIWPPPEGYKPPHLLGLLRFYIVGISDIKFPSSRPKNISFSTSAMELAEIGITVTANKTMELIDMTLINNVGTLFAKLSLAPMTLDRDCASCLVNMAAHELCTVQSFGAKKPSYSAVCSYLLLLAMLVSREEDVHELRERGLLQGGGGLTNKEALRFFTGFQGLRFGPHYYYIMVEIENYRNRCQTKTKLLTFFHNHKKTIAAVASGIGVVASIIATLVVMIGKLESLKSAS